MMGCWLGGYWETGYIELSRAEEPVDRHCTVTVVGLISGTIVSRKSASKS